MEISSVHGGGGGILIDGCVVFLHGRRLLYRISNVALYLLGT